MLMLWIVLCVSWIIKESHGKSGFCSSRTPVVRVCTDSEVMDVSPVYIDTLNVPTYQHTECECRIAPSDFEVNFAFTFFVAYGTEHIQFKINDIVLNNQTPIGSTILIGDTNLEFSTTPHFTNGGVCVMVSSQDANKFNITCSRTGTEITTKSSDFSPRSTEAATGRTQPHALPDDNEDVTDIIVPIAGAACGAVCLAVVILVVCYRRRNIANKRESMVSKSNVKKEPDDDDGEDDDDYYVTENPMYNQTDSQLNVQSPGIENHYMKPNKIYTTQNIPSEYHYIEPDHSSGKIDTTQNIPSEYHYIEPDHNCISSSHYESLPDSPLGKQVPFQDIDQTLEYDYTTCVNSPNTHAQSVSHSGTHATNQNSSKVSAAKKIWNVAETVYDHTDTQVNRFLGVNEYQHISPCAARRKVALDTYNTVGNVSDETKKEEHDDNCEYDITQT